MSTATVDAPEIEALVQQPEPSVLFVAKRSELRLVKRARRPMIVPATGERLGMTAGITISFAPSGEFRCPTTGEVTVMDPGGAGEATLPAEELLEFLERHPRCGDPNEGFQRVDPKAPPAGREELDRIVEAATRWDIPTLEAVIVQERAGWDRVEVVQLVEGSIEKIREAEARIAETAGADAVEAQQRAEAAEARVAELEAQAAKAKK